MQLEHRQPDRSAVETALPGIAADAALLTASPVSSGFVEVGPAQRRGRICARLRAMRRRPAVIFDRDNTLNVDHGYTYRPADLRWVDGAPDAIRALNRAGYWVLAATNQSGVARGFYGNRDVLQFFGEMQDQLRSHNARLDGFAWCPHHKAGSVAAYSADCRCRKPGPGMIEHLLALWPVDASRSVLIGDRDSDIGAARAAGLTGYRFAGGRLDEFVTRSVLSSA